MNFEYNGNLLEDERIEKVAQDIRKQYPEISLQQARNIAMLEGPISTPCDLPMFFERYYHIMLIMKDEKELVKKVFDDLILVLERNREHPKIEHYKTVLIEILSYLNGLREFPYLKEFKDEE